MNANEIYTACESLEQLAESMGFFRQEVCFRVNWIAPNKFTINIEMRTNPTDYDSRVSEYFHSDDPEVLFDQARNWIIQQDNPTQIRKQKFVKDLAHLVEEAEYLEMNSTPLREVFIAMTTNLLEHRTCT